MQAPEAVAMAIATFLVMAIMAKAI